MAKETTMLSLEAALWIDPKFEECPESDLSAYETKCDFIFNNIVDENKALLPQAIIIKTTGKAQLIF